MFGTEQINDLIFIVAMMFTGFCIGFGSAIGNYLANRTLIKNLENLINRINNKDSGDKKNELVDKR